MFETLSIHHDDAGAIVAIEANGTRHSPQALLSAVATAARYSAGLAAIADAHTFDTAAFARAVLAGATVDKALSDDVAAMAAPLPPDDQQELDRSIRRTEARRELVKAALRWARVEANAEEAFDIAEYDRAVEELRGAVDAFTALGGNEVIG